MKAASLKLKMYMGRVDIVDNSNLRKRLFHSMLMALGALTLSYTIILGAMVFNIVERRSLEKQAILLSNEVGSLELSYLSLSNKVDLDLSRSLGFKEVKPKFAVRKSIGFNSSVSKKLDNEI